MQMKRMLKYCNIYMYFRPNSSEDSDRKLFNQQMGDMSFLCDTLHVLLDPDKKNNTHEYGLLRTILGLPIVESSLKERTAKRAKTSLSKKKKDSEDVKSDRRFYLSYKDTDPSDAEHRRLLFYRYKAMVASLTENVSVSLNIYTHTLSHTHTHTHTYRYASSENEWFKQLQREC